MYLTYHMYKHTFEKTLQMSFYINDFKICLLIFFTNGIKDTNELLYFKHLICKVTRMGIFTYNIIKLFLNLGYSFHRKVHELNFGK
jgi:hypothetical protein